MANEKFERWYKGMVTSLLAMAEKTKDSVDSQTANDFIESHADLEQAFEAGQSEKVIEICKIISKFKTDDAPLLKEEPCCKVNMKNEKYYCQFHGLLRALDMWIEMD